MQIKLETTGHFFERRYHATLVDTDRYMLELLRYVHLNPVEAGLAKSVDAYHWSSHHNYIGMRTDPWVTTDFVLSMFSAEAAGAVAAYKKFVDAGQEKRWEPEQVIASGVAILGGDDFVARHSRSAPRAVSLESVGDLIDEAVLRFGVEKAMLVSPRRDAFVVRVRAWIGHQAAKRGIATLAAVARELGRTEGALRYALRAYPEEG